MCVWVCVKAQHRKQFWTCDDVEASLKGHHGNAWQIDPWRLKAARTLSMSCKELLGGSANHCRKLRVASARDPKWPHGQFAP